jgi:hypothetical protein
MSKFRKAIEYVDPKADAVIDPLPPPVIPVASLISTVFLCIDCKRPAAISHKGTTYCAPCYDQRAYAGTLVN